jgi:hypothetical protein
LASNENGCFFHGFHGRYPKSVFEDLDVFVDTSYDASLLEIYIYLAGYRANKTSKAAIF